MTALANNGQPLKSDLSAQFVRSILEYESETGILRWKEWPGFTGRKLLWWRKRWAGQIAGTIGKKGYVAVQIKRRLYLAHRLIWLIITGEWPIAEIDHINRVKSDNRWKNLRPATQVENARNRNKQIDNTSGFRGVFRAVRKTVRWHAKIRINGTLIHLGAFGTPEEASAAYSAAAVKYWGKWGQQ
jgi:hypothetical protein